ncbi:UNVERIFIED_CONTAM: hypothetical protein HHA_200330 [Hammondia hammondi]|eukprot:XP_008888781.1 hypothetical protein HHA_200330 [Hammondia hammondi]
MATGGFWLDGQAFQALYRSPDVPTIIKGQAFLLLNDTQSAAVDRESVTVGTKETEASQWVKRFCTVKANLFGFAPHSDAPFEGAYLLENVDVTSLTAKDALIKHMIPSLPPAREGEHIVYVTNKRDRSYGKSIVPLVVALPSRGGAQSWKAAISEANFRDARAEADRLRAESRKELSLAKRDQHKRDICVSKQEAQLESLELERQELMLEMQRLREKARRLQASGEVTEKAAAEYVDQKVSEISALQCQLAEELRQKAVLKETLSELREHASQQQRRLHSIEAKNRQLATSYTELLRDLEEANDNPARIALVASRSRSSNQRLTLENKKLREENRALTRHFHEIEDKFGQKLKMVRRVAEAGDIFNFLRKWLLCSENKIKFYEMGHKMGKEEAKDQRRKIQELQDELRIAEAVARSSYISVRSILLDEQLKSYTKHAEVPDIFSFVKTSLERFGWIFGEVESVRPVDRVFGVELPHWMHDGAVPSKAPFLERIYPCGGIEGSSRFSLVPGVDIMRPVESMIPINRFAALEASLRLLEVDHKELQENYTAASERLLECEKLIKDLREGEEGNSSWSEHLGRERGAVLKPM